MTRSSAIARRMRNRGLAMFAALVLPTLVAAPGYAADLHAAIRAGDIDAVQSALADPEVLNRADSWGRTPLIVALQQRNAAVVELLISRGASIRATDAWGRTPLLVAAQLKNTPALRLLLARGAEVDAANRNDITPLIAAAQTGNTEAVKLLLDARAAPDRADNLGWTALMWAAYRNDEATVRALLDGGADAARVSRDRKSTALGLARSRGATPAVIAALEARSRAGASGAAARHPPEASVSPPAARRHGLDPAMDAARVVRGNPNAAITIYEYTDFQCPYCAQGSRTVEEVLARYEGQVRLVVKHLPLPLLHPVAMACALHFEALALQGADKAWKFYDRIFADQRALAGGETYLGKVAAELGADSPRLQQDLRSDLVRNRVAADLDEAQRFKFDGVPAFIIIGTAIEGAQPAETFFSVIDAALNK